jgi:GR25 family glycosyltransferase involved in LPS biosynthesis
MQEGEIVIVNPSGIFVQVINLARRPDRLAKVSAELQSAGLNFDIQVAVDGQLDGYQSEFVSRGEIGCWKSHINAMREMVQKGASFSLVLEDDAVIRPVVNNLFLSKMTDLMERNNLDMLQIGFIESFYSASLKAGVLEFFISLLKSRGTRDISGARFVLGEFRAGTHAYIVNARLADAISRTVSEPPLIPWDGYLESLARGQIGRGDIRIARLVKSAVPQASRASQGLKVDSDIAS